MKFCLYIPVGNVTPGEFQSQTAIGEMTRALEQANIDACCVTDHPAPSSQWLHANGHDALDPFTALAFIAAASSRLKLQTNILVLPYRNPFITAKAATTLQILSEGRFILGVGSGYQQAEFEALGVDFHRRGRLTDEVLETIREIWQGGSIVKKGMGFDAKGNEPRPAPNPPPKIWIGGSSDKALLRAAKHDGWCPFFSIARHSKLNQDTGIQSVDDLKIKIEFILQCRREQNLTDEFDINIAFSSTDNFADRSREEADKFIEELRQLKNAGATWVTLKLPHPTRADYIENVHWFGEEVVKRMD
jgi:probable F420-dependent oxidoreductase